MKDSDKGHLQGCIFDLLVATDPTVGQICEIGIGLVYQTLMQQHQGDTAKVAVSMRELMNQAIDGIPVIQKAPMALVQTQKLDS